MVCGANELDRAGKITWGFADDIGLMVHVLALAESKTDFLKRLLYVVS